MAACDVLILGGGLAGLTLALDVRRLCPAATIRVIERRSAPAPVAIHKIGESTVEIAAHYFENVLGLQEHLRAEHLTKFGFRFFSSDGRERLEDVQEIGVSDYLSVTSFQIDRGPFENHLVERARAAGVVVELGAHVTDLQPGSNGERHRVQVRSAVGECTHDARWLVDASGRAALIKRRLGLAEANGHDANAVWFRVPFRIDIEQWTDDPEWLGRCLPGHRWRSTNHLVGDGYWVWLIPLACGHHSIGIVADAARHPFATMNSWPRALDWLRQHQPRLARVVEESGVAPADFAALKGFSYGCREVLSADRWAITGEAGVFLDPFYSPGSDFIAISNTLISDLIARDFSGRTFRSHAIVYSQLFRSFYDSTLSLYEGQYAVFGHPQALAAKVIWDYTFYWGVLCQMFFQRRMTDLALLGRAREDLDAARRLNATMQAFFRRWARTPSRENPPHMLDQATLGWFAALNASLRDTLDDTQFLKRMADSRARMAELAAEIVDRVGSAESGVQAWTETAAVLAAAGRAPARGRLLDYADAG